MRGYVLVAAVVAGSVLLLFGLGEWTDWPLLTDPSPVMDGAGVAAALLGLGLLTSDVVLPVPSSVVMAVHGALFGVVPGAALSLVGGVSATVVGFGVGRRGRRVLERLTTSDQRIRADRLLTRWGPWAVVVSRAVPVLAETVAVLAGTSSMRWPVLVLAGAAGTALPACLYAATGAGAGTAAGTALAAGLGLALAAALAAAGGRLDRSSPPARRSEVR
ncbi:VTT domain-containing protein [Geodermatophilus sp. SYSU D00697]